MSVVAARLEFGGPEAAVDLVVGCPLGGFVGFHAVVGVRWRRVARVAHSRVKGAFGPASADGFAALDPRPV